MLVVPVRKPKQEGSLITLLHIPYYVGRGDRLCTVRGMTCRTIVEKLRQENLSAQRQRIPINHEATLRPTGGPPFSKETLTASWFLKYTGRCPRLSCYGSPHLGMKSSTQQISRDLQRRDSAYRFFAMGDVPPSSPCTVKATEISRSLCCAARMSGTGLRASLRAFICMMML